MNTAEMTTERDRCKTAALAHAATIRTTPALPDYERVRIVALVNTYADCVDALNVGIAGGANATRDPLLDAAKAALTDYESRAAAGTFIPAAHLNQISAYARAAKLA